MTTSHEACFITQLAIFLSVSSSNLLLKGRIFLVKGFKELEKCSYADALETFDEILEVSY